MKRVAGSSVVALSFILAGCDIDGFDNVVTLKEDFHYSYDLKPGGRLELENFNGSVEITGWDKDTVMIDGTKQAATKDLLDEIKIDITNSSDSIRVRTVRPVERRGNLGVKYVISVPRKTRLDRIVSSNGAIRVQGVDGSARLKTSNGAVRAASLKGDVEITTSNGSVELSEFTGGAVLHTSNGSIHAQGIRGFFEATTSNGAIDCHVTEASGRPIRAESSNGRINLTVDSLNNTDVHASTNNASITVRLPAATQAQLKATTSNSSVTSDFDVAVRGTLSKHRLEGSIGTGGPLVDLSTSNGSIRIQKM